MTPGCALLSAPWSPPVGTAPESPPSLVERPGQVFCGSAPLCLLDSFPDCIMLGQGWLRLADFPCASVSSAAWRSLITDGLCHCLSSRRNPSPVSWPSLDSGRVSPLPRGGDGGGCLWRQRLPLCFPSLSGVPQLSSGLSFWFRNAALPKNDNPAEAGLKPQFAPRPSSAGTGRRDPQDCSSRNALGTRGGPRREQSRKTATRIFPGSYKNVLLCALLHEVAQL